MTMTNIRMKIAVAATVFGLGGLGGFAISSNPARNSQGTAQAQIVPRSPARQIRRLRRQATPPSR